MCFCFSYSFVNKSPGKQGRQAGRAPSQRRGAADNEITQRSVSYKRIMGPWGWWCVGGVGATATGGKFVT